MQNITVFDNTQKINCETIDEALRYSTFLNGEGFDVSISVNGIVMPKTDDDTFFYASVEAAKKDLVWCEELHTFVTKEWLSQFEGGCFDDTEDDFWDEAIDNIYEDIFGYTPVTAEDGQAIVRDADLAKICEKHGYDVLPCGDPDNAEEYWLIFAKGGEEEYFEKVYESQERFWDSDNHYSNGNNLEADYFDGQLWVTIDGLKLRRFDVSLEDAKNLICIFLNNPDIYLLIDEKHSQYIPVRYLEEMPFDADDGSGFNLVHATGREVLGSDGRWWTEYENSYTTEFEIFAE